MLFAMIFKAKPEKIEFYFLSFIVDVVVVVANISLFGCRVWRQNQSLVAVYTFVICSTWRIYVYEAYNDSN